MASTAATSTLDTAITIDQQTIERFESLNKWKRRAVNVDTAVDNSQQHEINTSEGSLTQTSVQNMTIPERFVYQHNHTKAANKGFPSVLENGRRQFGLTDHEVAALYGWTTGDYRFVNPIARGARQVTFQDYPFLPQDMRQVTFVLEQEEVLPYIQILNAALAKLPADHGQCQLWRGHSREITATVGTIFLLKGYISTTMDRERALDFCTKTDNTKINPSSPPRHQTLLCIVESKQGKCISKLSARPDEMEVLFPPDCVFEVVDAPATTREEDQRAVEAAERSLQQGQQSSSSKIELVYVKEVAPL